MAPHAGVAEAQVGAGIPALTVSIIQQWMEPHFKQGNKTNIFHIKMDTKCGQFCERSVYKLQYCCIIPYWGSTAVDYPAEVDDTLYIHRP